MNLAIGKATVEYDPDAADLAGLIETVEGAGYGVEVREAIFDISGMSCANCVGRVEKALRKVPGVLDVNVNLATEKARVEHMPGVAETRETSKAP